MVPREAGVCRSASSSRSSSSSNEGAVGGSAPGTTADVTDGGDDGPVAGRHALPFRQPQTDPRHAASITVGATSHAAPCGRDCGHGRTGSADSGRVALAIGRTSSPRTAGWATPPRPGP